uniref:Proteolipid protein 2 n=1 Tax=Salmo trutta TaxID=8032 RepID=A0A673XRJ2_SALTR
MDFPSVCTRYTDLISLEWKKQCLQQLLCYCTITNGVIILICYAVSIYGGYYGVAICEMVSAIIFFVVFMIEMDKSIQVVNWVWSDLLRASSGTGLYLITSLMSLIHGAGDGACIAGVVFGLLAGILFAYDDTAALTDDNV